MHIFRWVFESKNEGAQLPQINSLKKSIQSESALFHSLWALHEQKQRLFTATHLEGVKNHNRIIKINQQLDPILTQIVPQQTFSESLVRKIFVESSEGLHRIEAYVTRFGNRSGQIIASTTSAHIVQNGRRTPYDIEHAKIALWTIVKEENRLQDFIRTFIEANDSDFRMIIAVFHELRAVIMRQSFELRKNEWGSESTDTTFKIESDLMSRLEHHLTSIVNKLILFARESTNLELQERQIESQMDKDTKKIGVMLIHAITTSHEDMVQYADFLKDNKYVVYNVRLPGHGLDDTDLFMNTTLEEMEAFVISAFKYFYLYMKNLNGGEKGDGKFYVIGNSIGAMLATHVMAKKVNGLFIYQSLIKGFISISNAMYLWIIQEVVSGNEFLDRILTAKIVPLYFRISAKFGVVQHKSQKAQASIRPGQLPIHSKKTIERMGAQLLRLRQNIKFVGVPTLIIQGKKDHLTHPRSALYIEKHLGEALIHRVKPNLVFFGDSGHYPFLDKNKEKVYALTLEFLEQTEKKYSELKLAA